MMYENQMKALRWLANMFPYTHPTKSETDKMSNCIHLYCEQGANAIEELSMKLHGDEAAIAGMKREIERMVVADKPSWIPVSERLPEERLNPNTLDFVCVLCATIWGDVRPFKFGSLFVWDEPHFWDGGESMDKYVTHWMPLPEPPQEEV